MPALGLREKHSFIFLTNMNSEVICHGAGPTQCINNSHREKSIVCHMLAVDLQLRSLLSQIRRALFNKQE